MSQSADIQVLFIDTALLVVNKPAGLSTLPDGYDRTLPHIKSLLEQEAGRLWIVHRLDKETSGVLVLARTAEVHRSLNAQFEKHQVSKVYHSLVAGDPSWQEQTVSLPLRSNGDRRHRTVVDQEAGKSAVTHLRVLERLGQYCLLEAVPETGRTHQIRAHLSALGLFILGDKLYTPGNKSHAGAEADRYAMADAQQVSLAVGMGLHALSLEITHPLTGEKMKFTAPYPAELGVVLQQLRTSTHGG